jgi:hypothetical protein
VTPEPAWKAGAVLADRMDGWEAVALSTDFVRLEGPGGAALQIWSGQRGVRGKREAPGMPPETSPWFRDAVELMEWAVAGRSEQRERRGRRGGRRPRRRR